MSQVDPRSMRWGLVLGAVAFLPGLRIPIAGVDPIFYSYEVLVLVAAGIAVWDFFITKSAAPLPWTTIGTAAVIATFVAASLFGQEPLLSLGIARVTVEAAILAWSIPALVQRFSSQFFVWVALGGIVYHGLLFMIALGQHTDGAYEVTLEVRNDVSLLGGSLNNAASQFLMLLPLAFIGAAFSPRSTRVLTTIGVMVSTWGLVISESRALAGGLAIVAAGFLAGGLIIRLELRLRVRVFGYVLLSGLLLGLFTPQVVGAANTGADYLVSFIQGEGVDPVESPDSEEPEDIEDRNESSDLRRAAAWQLAIDDFIANPILGTGFRQRYLEGAREFFAHNVMFEDLAGTGTLGTLSFLILVGIYIRNWFRDRWSYWNCLVVAGVVAGFSVALVQPFLNTSHHYAAQWWLLLALGGYSIPELGATNQSPSRQEKVGASA